MHKNQDMLEYSISQYLDGTLSELERRELEARLASDAEARLVANEYAHLNQLLKSAPLTPSVDFESLGAQIFRQIEAEPARVPQPIRGAWSWTHRLAMAAGLVLLIGAALYWTVFQTRFNPFDPQTTSGNGVLEVQVMLPPPPQAASSIVIAVGPTDSLKQAGYTNGLVDSSVISRPARIVISSTDTPSAPGDRLY